MAPAAADSALLAGSLLVPAFLAGVFAPLFAGRESADGFGRCWASTSEKLGPFLFAGADLVPIASAMEVGATGETVGKGRGAVIWGFLLGIA
ncbi:hypothetical protein LMG1861_02175 [Achromobacter piechaudii]|uniref:Uncharacterized protein n=1 Tax=Achromobacter piechaudii TaxID=72556 RepID=A0A6S7CRD5_9BURK|nr:hypothetical protein LMG1861_02175 [Achromobacter piechaudii]